MEKKLIDVSKHQGVIDWAKVKASGIGGAIIRCGYGDNITSQDDSKFRINVEGCIANGIPFGVYIYSYAKTNEQAKSEAEHVLRLLAPYANKMQYPVYLDLEEAGTEQGAVERANIFGGIIEGAGYWCGVYANEYWWTNHLKGLERFTKWVAKYGVNDGKQNAKPSVSGCDIWQYTSVGSVPGINGNVDMNVCYWDLVGDICGTASQKHEDKTYTVKKDNTLSEIAKMYGTTYQALAQYNGIPDPNKIYVGQVIKIPMYIPTV